MRTVKLSYSILNMWSQGRFEDAVAMYLGKEIPATPVMELGKLKHEIWANHIKEHKQIPAELGGGDLKSPIVEQKWQKFIPFSDDYRILLRGVIDLEDDGTLIDHKCGLGNPTSYLDGLQLDYYKLLRPDAHTGKYLCHNPYKCGAVCQDGKHSCYSVGVKFLGDNNSEKALEHILTFGGEIIRYLTANKMLIDYRNRK